uniref:Chemokine interleukin-8-like domain-containing protein n=1 Tax=Salarias fasciatus TaxID=181472 RepID=A0A672HI84_SALFA
MDSRLAALLFLGIICFGFATGEAIRDCCLSATSKHLPPQVVQSYALQKAGDGCKISATVIITKAGRKLCLMHPDENSAVQSVLDTVDQRKQ